MMGKSMGLNLQVDLQVELCCSVRVKRIHLIFVKSFCLWFYYWCQQMLPQLDGNRQINFKTDAEHHHFRLLIQTLKVSRTWTDAFNTPSHNAISKKSAWSPLLETLYIHIFLSHISRLCVFARMAHNCSYFQHTG